MRIVFDVTSCAKPRRKGIANYGAELVRSCARVAPEHQIVLAVRPSRWLQRRLVSDIVPGRPRLLLDTLHGPLLGGPVDVLHGIGVRLPERGRFPKVVTIHDTNVFDQPELSSEAWRTRRRRRLRQTVARADLVLACSEHGSRAVQEHLDVPAERIRVVPEGVDLQRFRRPEPESVQRVTARLGLHGVPYVLCIGTADRRKNHAGLLDAFVHARLPEPWRLVLAGPGGDRARELRERAAALGLPEERLHVMAWIEDDELPALLAGAQIYACASLHEGFGLPVLEAQACGVAVACSNRAALPETLGGCGVSFDPGDLDDFASALSRLASDDALREDLGRRGPARVARHYSWDRVARDTLAALAEAAARAA